MARCIAVLGQPGVGKTTLTDHLAALEAGRPPGDAGNNIRCVSFPYLNDNWTLLDCPGSIEQLQKSMNALLVSDAAVLVVSPDTEQSVLASPYMKLLERSGIPYFIFVNRVDEMQSRLRDLVAELQTYSSHTLMLRQVPIRKDRTIVGAVDLISERAWRYREEEPSDLIEIPADMLERETEARGELLDALADHDDTLLEQIIEDKVPAARDIFGICSRVLEENTVTPILTGSAVHGNGMVRLMKALRHESPLPDATRKRLGGDPIAVTFDAQHRKHLGKITRLRSFVPDVKQASSLGGATIGGMVEPEGAKPSPLAKLEPGSIGMAVKSDHLQPARMYSADSEMDPPNWYEPLSPLLSRVITAKHERDDVKLSEALAKVVADDPALAFRRDEHTSSQILETQGVQHLRQTRDLLADVFDVETQEAVPPTAYCETIAGTIDQHYRHKKQSGGSGQYADIKIEVAPAERGAGVSFAETIHGGAVPKNFIPAVETGVRETCAKGPNGCPLTDISVNLHDGGHHAVDSSDMAFRIAGRMGLLEAVRTSGSVLLEPYSTVRIYLPQVFSGVLGPMVAQRRGQILGFNVDESAPGWDIHRALMPTATLHDLIADLRSATQGIGRFDAEHAHYQELYGREADEVLASLKEGDAPAKAA